MTNQNLRKMANIIASSNKINLKEADKILNKLTRSELIIFTQHLRTLVAKRTVKILSQIPLDKNLQKILISKFSDKNVVFEKADVGDGIFAVLNDTIIDLTTNGFVNQTVENLKEN